MDSLFRSLRAKSLFLLVCVPLLILSACGGNTSTTNTNNPNANISLTVGGKLDTESKIITKLYTLDLRDAGFKVNEKPAFGNNTITFAGIKSGAIDLYPEFTATGLDALKKTSSLSDQTDYDTVKAGFKSQFNIDWLDYSPLNDTYAVCVKQGSSIKTLSDLATQAKQVTFDLPSDSTYVVDYLKAKYNLTLASFKAVHKVDYSIGFKEVQGGQSQANFCYSTDSGITTDKLAVLQDDKGAFPAYHPAPIVRDSVLKKSADIATTLNALAPDITTQASLDLQQQVIKNMAQNMSQDRAIYQAAKDFLTSKGLCKKAGCTN
jgi:osmoprotectant transport system substrate-binding protein